MKSLFSILVLLCLTAGTARGAAPQAPAFRPELVLQAGHSGKITALAASPDGRWAASGSADSTVKIWDMASGTVLRTLVGHEDPVTTVAISPDGRLLASGSWEAPEAMPATMEGLMAAASGGGQEGGGGAPGTVKLWDAATGREIRSLQAAGAGGAADMSAMMGAIMGGAGPGGTVAFSQDGRLLSAVSGDTVKVWDAASGKEVREMRPDGKNQQEIVAFSGDGRWLVTGGTKTGGSRFGGMVPRLPGMGGGAPSVDYKMVLWDVPSGRDVRKIEIKNASARTASAISQDGRFLAVASLGNDQKFSVRVIDTTSGAEVRAFTVGADQNAGMMTGSLAFTPDGGRIAVNGMGMLGGETKIFDVATGAEVRTIGAQGGIDFTTIFQGGGVSAFSADGRVLATGGAGTVALWDVATGARLNPTRPEDAQPFTHGQLGMVSRMLSGGGNTVAFSPDGRWLASAGGSTVRLWDIATGNRASAPQNQALMAPIAFSPDGKWLATRGMDQSGSSIRLVEPGTWREIGTAKAGSASGPDGAADAGAMTLSPDGRFVASGGGLKGLAGGGGMFGGAPKLEYNPVRIVDVATGREVSRIQVGSADAASMMTMGQGVSVTFSPDGRLLATGGGFSYGYKGAGWKGAFGLPGMRSAPKLKLKDMAVKVVEVATGREVRSFKGGGAKAFSPDGRVLALTASTGDQKTFQIKLVDVTSGGDVATIDAGEDTPGFIAFSPDGKLVAATSTSSAVGMFRSSDHTVRVWDAASGRPVVSLSHAVGVDAFAFSPDGKLIASNGGDGNTSVWDARTGELLVTLIQTGFGGDWLVVTPDGLFDGTANAWNRIFWRFSDSTFDVGPAELFFNEFYYPGLLADVLAGKKPKAARDISQIDRRQPRVKLEVAGTQGPAAVTTRTATVKIEVAEAAADATHANGSGARDVRLFRNGSLVKVWRGEVASGRATLEATIPVVAGENRLTAYAFNRDNVKSTDATVTVTGAEALRRKGTAYVLAIGVNEYQNAQYNLKYAAADARAFGDEIKKEQQKVGAFERVEVVPLLDEDATKANILAALARLDGSRSELPAGAPAALQAIERAQPEDAVIIYFAGHGTAQQARFYLIPHDLGYAGSRTELDAGGLEKILASSISDQELERAIESLDAGRLLLVIDACNSGQALEAEEKRRGPMNSKGLAQLAYEKGMYILAAAQGYQAALEAAQLGHGYLTFALVEEGLKTKAADGAPADGQIVAREWLDFATRRVPEMQEAKEQATRKLEHEEPTAQPTVEARIAGAQRPRVFYRREAETQPLVVAKP